jgi:hypothetical protein
VLVVSVYDRRSWYYPVYRFGSPVVRRLRDWIGDVGLKVTLFPFWHAGVLLLMAAATRRPFWIPFDISWNLFHDQFTTPHCTFHTLEELSAWAQDEGPPAGGEPARGRWTADHPAAAQAQRRRSDRRLMRRAARR